MTRKRTTWMVSMKASKSVNSPERKKKIAALAMMTSKTRRNHPLGYVSSFMTPFLKKV